MLIFIPQKREIIRQIKWQGSHCETPERQWIPQLVTNEGSFMTFLAFPLLTTGIVPVLTGTQQRYAITRIRSVIRYLGFEAEQPRVNLQVL